MKTKLGISTGLLGAALFLTGLFSGYTVLTLLAGYVLLFEQDEWLKKTAIKAFTVCIGFSVLSALVGFVPNAINLIDAVASVFNGTFYIGFVSNIVNLAQVILTVAEKVLLLLLAFKALKHSTVKINIVDRLIDEECGGHDTKTHKTGENRLRFCTNCGSQISDSAAFCPKCGTKG